MERQKKLSEKQKIKELCKQDEQSSQAVASQEEHNSAVDENPIVRPNNKKRHKNHRKKTQRKTNSEQPVLHFSAYDQNTTAETPLYESLPTQKEPELHQDTDVETTASTSSAKASTSSATTINHTCLEDLLCPITVEPMLQARCLPCGHTFSQSGLQEHITLMERKEMPFECPICRNVFNKTSICVNYTVQRMASAFITMF